MNSNDFGNDCGFLHKKRKARKKPLPYEKMSQLDKDVHDARENGLTYGFYMAKKEREKADERME